MEYYIHPTIKNYEVKYLGKNVHHTLSEKATERKNLQYDPKLYIYILTKHTFTHTVFQVGEITGIFSFFVLFYLFHTVKHIMQ